jgi:hypothetical protein
MGSAVGALGIEVVAVEDGVVAVQYLIQPRVEAFAAKKRLLRAPPQAMH